MKYNRLNKERLDINHIHSIFYLIKIVVSFSIKYLLLFKYLYEIY